MTTMSSIATNQSSKQLLLGTSLRTTSHNRSQLNYDQSLTHDADQKSRSLSSELEAGVRYRVLDADDLRRHTRSLSLLCGLH